MSRWDERAVAEAEGEMRATETARSGGGARGWPRIIYTKVSTLHKAREGKHAPNASSIPTATAPRTTSTIKGSTRHRSGGSSASSPPLPVAPSQRRRVAASSQVIACSTRREVEDGKHNDKGDKKRWCESKHPPAGVTPRGRPAARASRRDRVQICLRKKRNACVMVAVMDAKERP
jgi:hypothetical protein